MSSEKTNTQGLIENWDMIVIGGGLMGSSAAWHLSKAGIKVLLLEKQNAEYNEGSSFGDARIARSLGSVKDIFSYLHNRSVSETHELIHFLNQASQSRTHHIDEVYTTSPVTYIYYSHAKQALNKLLKQQQDKYEIATSAKEAMDKFGMTVAENAIVIREFKQYSGTLNPKILIEKLHLGIEIMGGEIRYLQKVHSVKSEKNIFKIQTTNLKTGLKYILESKKIVVTAGPYTGDLMNDVAPYFKELIKPQRVPLIFIRMKPEYYFKLSDSQRKRLTSYYPIIDLTEELMYSMIEKNDEDGIPIIKIGAHYLRTKIDDLDELWKKEVSEEEKVWGLEKTVEYLKRINILVQSQDLVFVKGYSCVYSLSENEIPIVSNILNIDSQPNPNAVVIAAMSGIGAKGALAYGRLGADLILQRSEQGDMYAKTKVALGHERLKKNLK